MILKASDLCFPESIRTKYFPFVLRASPPEGWPDGPIVVSEKRVPCKCFLQAVGASPATEFSAEVGDFIDNDHRISLSMLEEIALNCPLREDEASEIKREYENACKNAGEPRPPLFVQGLIPAVFCAFQNKLLSFSSALVLSLYTSAEAQSEIVRLNFLDRSPEVALKILTDPFSPGDILNRLAREPEKLKALGCDTLREFLIDRSPISYGRGRFLMRLAAAIPSDKRAGLTNDQAELLLSIGKARREGLFRGKWISIYGSELDFNGLKGLSRTEARRLIRKTREKRDGYSA